MVTLSVVKISNFYRFTLVGHDGNMCSGDRVNLSELLPLLQNELDREDRAKQREEKDIREDERCRLADKG